MGRGTIILVDLAHGYGLIPVDGTGEKQAFFRIREIVGTTLHELSAGQVVDFGYLDGRGGRGLATLVRLVPPTGGQGPAKRA